jgi:hypothetical protein
MQALSAGSMERTKFIPAFKQHLLFLLSLVVGRTCNEGHRLFASPCRSLAVPCSIRRHLRGRSRGHSEAQKCTRLRNPRNEARRICEGTDLGRKAKQVLKNFYRGCLPYKLLVLVRSNQSWAECFKNGRDPVRLQVQRSAMQGLKVTLGRGFLSEGF